MKLLTNLLQKTIKIDSDHLELGFSDFIPPFQNFGFIWFSGRILIEF